MITKAEAQKILLETALKQTSDDTFRYHVNAEKNDFYKWVREVIGDDRLARELLRTTSRLQAAKAVGTRISSLLRSR